MSQQEPKKLPFRLLGIGLALGLVGHSQVAYILSILNPAELVFQRFVNESFAQSYGATLTDAEWRFLYTCVINSAFLGFLLCCLLMPVLAERFGRLACFWMGTAGVALGSAMSGSAKGVNSFQVYMLGRFIASFSSMLALSVLPLFLTEISPKQHRGLVNVVPTVQIYVSSLLASFLCMPNILGTDQLWPIIHWLEIVPCLVAAAVLPFCHESPKYLLARGSRGVARVAESLRFYQGAAADVAQTVGEIEKEALSPADRLSFWAALRHPDARRGLVVGVVLNAVISVNGHVASGFFATHELRKAGLSNLHASYGNLLIVFVGVLGSLAAVPTLDRLGRRTLLIWSYAITWLAMAMVWAVLLLHELGFASDTWTAAVVIGGFVAHRFLAGLATLSIPFFITAEMVPQNARAACQALAIAARYVTVPLGAALFFSMEGLVGSWSMLMFVIPLGFVNAYLYFSLPETKFRDVGEVRQAFDELPLPRDVMRKISSAVSLSRLAAATAATDCESVDANTTQIDEGSTEIAEKVDAKTM